MTRPGWVIALVLTGVGLYFSNGVIDLVSGPPGVVRVAMLPPAASATRPAAAAVIDPEARARVPVLDEFDAGRRPIVVLYDPLSRISPQEALGHVALIARPGQRTAREPLELLWNARFSLPAGTYRVALSRTPLALPLTIGVQFGRVGAPLDRWVLVGGASERRVTLPIDATLFGLRVEPTTGQPDGELRISALGIVDASRRIRRPAVLGAARYGSTIAFFHDDTTAGERTGYWTRGRGTTQVTYATSEALPAVEIDVSCGPIPNHVTLASRGWADDFALMPGASRHVALPTADEPELGTRLAPLDITVRDGFVPADLDRTSTDRRRLGCWIDMDGRQ
jgi:hypothetical protein